MTDDATDRLIDATLDLEDDSPESSARISGWLEAWLRGFHQRRAGEDLRTRWIASQQADEAVHRGLWEHADQPLSSDVPVATFGHLIKTLNTGLDVIPAWMITDVTVAPTHRRQGLLRHLMTDNLAAAAAAGMPLAVLTSSEGAIYQRFGFGVATRTATVRVETAARFRLREGARPAGRVRIVEPERSWPTVAAIAAREVAVTRGALGRPAFYQQWHEGYDWRSQAPLTDQRLAVHSDENGVADGFLAYAVTRDESVSTVAVRDLIATTPAAHLALWQFLADIDLTDVVTAATLVEDPLVPALVDPRVRHITEVHDHLWLRVLDVPAALAARPWFGEGRIVVRVHDGLGHADGTYAITASQGRADVTPTDEDAEVILDVETLGMLYLGDARVWTLADAGRLSGSDAAIERLSRLADGGRSPHCSTHF